MKEANLHFIQRKAYLFAFTEQNYLQAVRWAINLQPIWPTDFPKQDKPHFLPVHRPFSTFCWSVVSLTCCASAALLSRMTGIKRQWLPLPLQTHSFSTDPAPIGRAWLPSDSRARAGRRRRKREAVCDFHAEGPWPLQSRPAPMLAWMVVSISMRSRIKEIYFACLFVFIPRHANKQSGH